MQAQHDAIELFLERAKMKVFSALDAVKEELKRDAENKKNDAEVPQGTRNRCASHNCFADCC